MGETKILQKARDPKLEQCATACNNNYKKDMKGGGRALEYFEHTTRFRLSFLIELSEIISKHIFGFVVEVPIQCGVTRLGFLSNLLVTLSNPI